MFDDEDDDDDDLADWHCCYFAVVTMHSWGNGQLPQQNNIDWILLTQLNLWHYDVNVGAFVIFIIAPKSLKIHLYSDKWRR